MSEFQCHVLRLQHPAKERVRSAERSTMSAKNKCTAWQPEENFREASERRDSPLEHNGECNNVRTSWGQMKYATPAGIDCLTFALHSCVTEFVSEAFDCGDSHFFGDRHREYAGACAQETPSLHQGFTRQRRQRVCAC